MVKNKLNSLMFFITFSVTFNDTDIHFTQIPRKWPFGSPTSNRDVGEICYLL